MIFVTVGTHEQPFNRLIKYIDNMKKDNLIVEDVIIQIGFSTYQPKYCKWQRLFHYKEMIKNVDEARIVITHGGPSSFIMPLQVGKIPIVVPRKKEFDEHVNNHQVDFCREVANRHHNIIEIEDIRQLDEVIMHYEKIVTGMNPKQNSNNKKFCMEFTNIVNEMFIR